MAGLLGWRNVRRKHAEAIPPPSPCVSVHPLRAPATPTQS